MKSIQLSSHLSLAYELGAGFYSKEKQSQLYDVTPGEEIRGQNLKVTTVWQGLKDTHPAQLYQNCLLRQKEQLKKWDHSFIKQEGAFKSQALTLENVALHMAMGFLNFSGPRCLALEIEQGPWGVRVGVDSQSDPTKKDQITLRRQLRFQSLAQTRAGFEPIDMVVVLAWSGRLDRTSGLLCPWTELLMPIGRVYQSLRLESSKYFEAESTAQFLKTVALRFFREDSLHLLTHVSFIDTKDNFEISFNRLKEIS